MRQDDDARKGRNPEGNEQADDVATLYSWANLHGAKYRDFSASRQEMRLQMRQRTLAERARVARDEAQKTPAALGEGPRWADLLPDAAGPVAPVRHEIAGARRLESAEELERMPGKLTAPAEPGSTTRHGLAGAPYFRDETVGEARPPYSAMPEREAVDVRPAWLAETSPPPAAHVAPPAVAVPPPVVPVPQAAAPVAPPVVQAAVSGAPTPLVADRVQPVGQASPVQTPLPVVAAPAPPVQMQPPVQALQPVMPVPAPATPVPGSDFPQPSRVATRWYALRGVFGRGTEDLLPAPIEGQVPALAVFSLAGGVGKTSLVAAMGRALAARGERVLLTDTCSFGVLAFYFGAREAKPGVMRTFGGASSDPVIRVLTLDADRYAADPDLLRQEMVRGTRDVSRVLIDVATGSAAMLRQALRMAPTVLVPVVPDMASVVTLQALEGFFRNQESASGKPMQAWYVMNQFDPSSPLHQDVGEILRQQLGERLLPFAVHRSPAVSEALAEGMTVIDYAPHSPAAEDVLNLATWIRNLSVALGGGHRGMRWSER